MCTLFKSLTFLRRFCILSFVHFVIKWTLKLWLNRVIVTEVHVGCFVMLQVAFVPLIRCCHHDWGTKYCNFCDHHDFITKNLSADTTSFFRHLHVDSDSCVTMLVILIILMWPNHAFCFQTISNIFRNGKQTVWHADHSIYSKNDLE